MKSCRLSPIHILGAFEILNSIYFCVVFCELTKHLSTQTESVLKFQSTVYMVSEQILSTSATFSKFIISMFCEICIISPMYTRNSLQIRTSIHIFHEQVLPQYCPWLRAAIPHSIYITYTDFGTGLLTDFKCIRAL